MSFTFFLLFYLLPLSSSLFSSLTYLPLPPPLNFSFFSPRLFSPLTSFPLPPLLFFYFFSPPSSSLLLYFLLFPPHSSHFLLFLNPSSSLLLYFLILPPHSSHFLLCLFYPSLSSLFSSTCFFLFPCSRQAKGARSILRDKYYMGNAKTIERCNIYFWQC